MPRDYKHRVTQRRKRRGPAPWVWLVAGLAIGLFMALLVYLQTRPGETPTAAPATTGKPQDTRDVRRKPARPIPPPPKPRFEFYNKFPEMEVVIPEEEITGIKKQGVKQVRKPGIYLLQAGSFRNHQQAEQLRARLALLGMQTRIQAASNWHRVRVGPYKNLSELNRARSLLKKNGIDAILIRLKK